MRTFYLFGHNISYSLSPAIQGAALDELGLPHTYEIRDVSPDDFPVAVESLRGTTSGANVTIPHKEAAYRLMDDVSEEAEEMRSVNTIVVDGDRLIGHNTDLPAIEEVLTALNPGGVEHAVVIGSGGASRAVQYALFRRDVAVTVVQRRDRTLSRIGEFLGHAQLLVNCAPIGTLSDELPLDPELLRPDLAVFDMVYQPTPTALVRAARAVGAPATSGGTMLVGQAWRSLGLWLEADGVHVGREFAQPMFRAMEQELGGRDE